MIEVRTSTIHGQGVFAVQRLPRGRALGLYTGKRLHEAQLPYYKPGTPTYYWMLSNGWYIAGDTDLRFINHSCAPNVSAQEVRVRGRLQVQFRVLKPIAVGDELLLDYNLQAGPDDDDPYTCLCGAAECRQTMLAPPETTP